MKTHDPMTNKTKGPIPLPAGEVPSGIRCVSICIPDDNEYYRMLFGAIYELTHWNNYERDDTHKATLVAQAWRKALLEGMLRCNMMRIADGIPEFSNDGGATWTAVPQVAPGDSGHEPQNNEPIRPARTGSNKPCLASANATACFVELHREVCAWWDAGAIVLVFCGAIAAVLGLFYPILWGAFAATVNYLTIINAILQHTDVLTPESFTSTIQDELTCIFYCHADVNGQWSEDAATLIEGDIAAKTGSMWELIRIYFNQIGGYRALNNAGTTNSIATHDCGGCGCGWCYTLDFEEGDQGFSPVVAQGQNIAIYAAGIGWQAVYNRNGQHVTEIRIERTLSTGGQFSSVDIEYSYVQATTDGYTLYFNVNIGPVPAGSHVHKVVTFAEVDETRLRTDMADTVDSGGQLITIHKMTFRGIGDNPFGGDNCT